MVILFVLLQAPYRIVAQSWPGTMTQCRWVGTVGKRKITGAAEGVLQCTTSTSTALLVECVPASTVPDNTVPANSAPQGLQSVSEVMRANSKLCVPARASTLAVKLARDAIFGEEVMLQITLTCGRGGFKQSWAITILLVLKLRVLATIVICNIYRNYLDV